MSDFGHYEIVYIHVGFGNYEKQRNEDNDEEKDSGGIKKI